MNSEQLFWYLKLANYLLLLFALPFTVFFIRVVSAAKSVHSNLRCLLILVSVEFRLLGLSRMIAELSETFIKDDISVKLICSTMSFLNSSAMGSVQLSFLAILVERSVATLYHSNYEHWRSGLAKSFTTLELIYALAFGLKVYQLNVEIDVKSSQIYNATCVWLNKQPMLLVYSWVVFGLLVILAAGPMFLLYKYNKRLSQNPGNGSLTTRYQFNDNVLILRIFLPLFVIGVFCVGGFCSMIIFYVYLELKAGKPVSTKIMLLIRVTFLLTDLCTLMLELHFLNAHPVLRCWAKKKMWRCLRSPSLQPTRIYVRDREEGQLYFQQFALAWK